MRRAWYAGMIAGLALCAVSDALAQSFCSDLDRVVRLARSRFLAIRDDTNRRELKTPVTRRLPGAAECWYHDASQSYWCAWEVALAERRSRVERLAGDIGRCYRVEPAWDDKYADETSAYLDLPDAVAIYVNGVGRTVEVSIASRSPLRDPYPQAP